MAKHGQIKDKLRKSTLKIVGNAAKTHGTAANKANLNKFMGQDSFKVFLLTYVKNLGTSVHFLLKIEVNDLTEA